MCPGDAKLTGECRPSAGVCDFAEVCDGVADDCPADALEPPTTECRAAEGACDAPELCTGSGVVCPGDAKLTGECRAEADVCDLAEVCDGVSDDCPVDANEPAGTPCDDHNVCTENEECSVAGICTGDDIESCTLPALNPWSQILVGLFILASGLGLVSQRRR